MKGKGMMESARANKMKTKLGVLGIWPIKKKPKKSWEVYEENGRS